MCIMPISQGGCGNQLQNALAIPKRMTSELPFLLTNLVFLSANRRIVIFLKVSKAMYFLSHLSLVISFIWWKYLTLIKFFKVLQFFLYSYVYIHKCVCVHI